MDGQDSVAMTHRSSIAIQCLGSLLLEVPSHRALASPLRTPVKHLEFC